LSNRLSEFHAFTQLPAINHQSDYQQLNFCIWLILREGDEARASVRSSLLRAEDGILTGYIPFYCPSHTINVSLARCLQVTP
jgi:hypothetical protein